MASLKFPIQLDPGRGTLKLSDGTRRVEEQIQEILTTNFLERVLRPEFGSDVMVFEAVSNPELIAARINFSLRRYLSVNIEINVRVRVPQQGTINLDIGFVDTSTNQQGNVRSSLTF